MSPCEDSKAPRRVLPAARQKGPRLPFRHVKSGKATRQSGRRLRARHSAGTARDARRERVPIRQGSPFYPRPVARRRNPAPTARDSAYARRGHRAGLPPRRAHWRVAALVLSPRLKSPRMPQSRRQAPASEPAAGLRPALRSKGSGSHPERRANSSSLLFSCTGVNSLVYLAFHGLAKCIFPDFMERNAIHRNLFHAAVIQLIALAEKISARLRISYHGNHAVRRFHDAVEPQRADLQTSFAWWQHRGRARLRLLPRYQRLKWIASRRNCSLFAFLRRVWIHRGLDRLGWL